MYGNRPLVVRCGGRKVKQFDPRADRGKVVEYARLHAARRKAVCYVQLENPRGDDAHLVCRVHPNGRVVTSR